MKKRRYRALKIAGLIILNVAFWISSLAESRPVASCITDFKSLYFASGKKNNPVQFSYEIEFSLSANPKLLEFYKVQSYTDEQWFAMPLQKRLEVAQTYVDSMISRGRTTLLVKTEKTPHFLAEKVIDAKGGRLELAMNEVNTSLDEIKENLEWTWREIGPGSIQGHASIKKDARAIENSVVYAKHDSEISYLGSLERSFARYNETGEIRSSVIENPSLGPIDRRTFDSLSARVAGRGRYRNELNDTDKLIYGTTYRPDLYGLRRTGFEVRNCHKNLDCIMGSLKSVAEGLENGFKNYAGIKDDVLVDAGTLTKWNDQTRSFLTSASRHFDSLTELSTGGAPMELRLSLPLANWEQHPLLLGLSADERLKAVERIKVAREAYVAEMDTISRSTLPVGEKLKSAIIAMSRWSVSTQLSRALRAGRSTVVGKFDGPTVAASIENEGSRYTPAQISGLRRIAKSSTKFADNEQVGMAIQRLSELGLSYEEAKKIVRRERKGPISVFKILNFGLANSGVRFLNEHAGVKMADCFASSNCKEIANSFARIQTEAADVLASVLKQTEFGRKAPDSFVGLTAHVLTATSPDVLTGVGLAAKRMGLENALGEVISSPFIHKIPDEFGSAANAEALLTAFARNDSGKLDAANTILSSIYLKGEVITQTVSENKAHQAILSKLATNVSAVDAQSAILKIGSQSYLLSVDRTQTKLTLKAISNSQLKGLELKSQRYIGGLNVKNGRALNSIVLQDLVASNPDSIFVLSSPRQGINHQALLVDGQVYETGGPNLAAEPLSTWLAGWGTAKIVQIRPAEDKLEALRQHLDRHSGPNGVGVESDPRPNCASAVSCALEAANIFKFPDRYRQRDAIGQLGYLTSMSRRDPQIISVTRTTDVKPPLWTEADTKKTIEGITGAAAGLAIGVVGAAGIGATAIGASYAYSEAARAWRSTQPFDPNSASTSIYFFKGSDNLFAIGEFYSRCEKVCGRVTCSQFRWSEITDADSMSCLLPSTDSKYTNRQAYEEIKRRLEGVSLEDPDIDQWETLNSPRRRSINRPPRGGG